MRKFLRSCRGAVTVMVTLLLIPAILVSGTAVDLARIYTTHSAIQNANQLAANSAMASYDALLKDLYGLYGFMQSQDDPGFNRLIDDYIKTTVFGDSPKSGVGLFPYSYSSDTFQTKLTPSKNLSHIDVLRQQILEYMKFRGPVILVTSLLDALKGNDTIQKDKEAIDQVKQIQEGFAELYELYYELYKAINEANGARQKIGMGSGLSYVSGGFNSINGVFVKLRNAYNDWNNASDQLNDKGESEKDKYRKAYEEELIKAEEEMVRLINGGKNNDGLIVNRDKAITFAEEYKKRFDRVVDAANKLENQRTKLEQQLEEVEKKLDAGEYSKELTASLRKELAEYRKMLGEPTASMAKTYRDKGYAYVEEVKEMLRGVNYRDNGDSSKVSLTLDQLVKLRALVPGLALDLNNKAAQYAAYNASYEDSMPKGFQDFGNIPGHEKFWNDLANMVKNGTEAPSSDQEAKQKDATGKLEKQAENIFNTGLKNNPAGAKYINGAGITGPESFDLIKAITEAITGTVNTVGKIIEFVADPAQSLKNMGDYALVLTYGTSMFSNYTTSRPGNDDVTSITGIPMNTRVNYFYQSEWEYLFHGSNSAGANLNSITTLLVTVRAICNFISSYSITEISAAVDGIRLAFAWAPPLAIILSFAARLAYVALETAYDVGQLRLGFKIPLLKNDSNWICSVTGAIQGAKDKNEGLSYSNYMLIFFAMDALATGKSGNKSGITVATERLTERVRNLVEWNMVNYTDKVNAKESAMSTALAKAGRFKMANAVTDFSITTTVDIRMLFLSMPFAQKGVNGVIPPKTLAMTQTDYRGY